MTTQTEFEKFNQLRVLLPGTKVLLTDNSIAEFKRLKQKKFIGVIDGSPYDIPVGMFVKVTEEVTPQDKESASKKLKKDDWFYISQSGKALLFKYIKHEGATIIGLNPVTDVQHRISPSLFEAKVE